MGQASYNVSEVHISSMPLQSIASAVNAACRVKLKKEQHSCVLSCVFPRTRHICFLGSNSDESSYPSSFDEEMTQRATATFDWVSVVPDESVRREKAAKCIEDVRTILNKRRLVSEATRLGGFLCSHDSISSCEKQKHHVRFSADSLPVGPKVRRGKRNRPGHSVCTFER